MALTKSIALLIQAEDQPGVLYQLTRVIASHQANISTIDIVGRWQTNASVYLELQDISDLEQLLKDIGALPVVKLIEQPETECRSDRASTAGVRGGYRGRTHSVVGPIARADRSA